MHSNYHFMKTLTNERINARLAEAEVYRLARSETKSKSRRFAFNQIRGLLTAIITLVRHHPTPVVHWEFGRLHR